MPFVTGGCCDSWRRHSYRTDTRLACRQEPPQQLGVHQLDLTAFVSSTGFRVPREQLDLSSLSAADRETVRQKLRAAVSTEQISFGCVFAQKAEAADIVAGLTRLAAKPAPSFFSTDGAVLRQPLPGRWLQQIQLVRYCTHFNLISKPFQLDERLQTTAGGVTMREVRGLSCQWVNPGLGH